MLDDQEWSSVEKTRFGAIAYVELALQVNLTRFGDETLPLCRAAAESTDYFLTSELLFDLGLSFRGRFAASEVDLMIFEPQFFFSFLFFLQTFLFVQMDHLRIYLGRRDVGSRNGFYTYLP